MPVHLHRVHLRPPTPDPRPPTAPLRRHSDVPPSSSPSSASPTALDAALGAEPRILWQKGELLGSGAFGQVFMGMNLDTGELMAVKRVSLRSQRMGRGVEAAVQRNAAELEEEVAILKRLKHPNIVRYLGTGASPARAPPNPNPAHMHTYTRAHMHTCTRAHAHTCTRADMHTCTRAHAHTTLPQSHFPLFPLLDCRTER